MKHDRRLVVRGRQRSRIDPALLVQVLLAIVAEWDAPGGATGSPRSVDTFDAAIEDREAGE
jgi:hypothetical protein